MTRCGARDRMATGGSTWTVERVFLTSRRGRRKRAEPRTSENRLTLTGNRPTRAETTYLNAARGLCTQGVRGSNPLVSTSEVPATATDRLRATPIGRGRRGVIESPRLDDGSWRWTPSPEECDRGERR